MVGPGAGPEMSGPGAKLRWARKTRSRCRILDGGDDAQPAATAGRFADGIQMQPGGVPGVGGPIDVVVVQPGGPVRWIARKALHA